MSTHAIINPFAKKKKKKKGFSEGASEYGNRADRIVSTSARYSSWYTGSIAQIAIVLKNIVSRLSLSERQKGTTTYFTRFSHGPTQKSSLHIHICDRVSAPAISSCSTLVDRAKVDELLGEAGGAAAAVDLVAVCGCVVCECSACG